MEDVALKLLSRPMYCVFVTEEFARNVLYNESEAAKWKELTDEFVRNHGEAFRDALMLQLADDYDWDRWHRLPATRTTPRKYSLSFSPMPITTHLATSIPYLKGSSPRLMNAIAFLKSSKVDEKVLELFKSLGSGHFADHSDDYFALACMRRMISAGYRQEVREYCKRRIPLATHHKDELQGLVNILNASR